MKKRKSLSKAGLLLSTDSVRELMLMVDKIYDHANNVSDTDLIDHIDGIQVWEKVEFEFTCREFINYIENE